MFCTTTTSPIHATRPGPRNNRRCAIHIAHNKMAPAMPNWIATAKVWLCGFDVMMPEDDITPSLPVLPNSDVIEPVPCPNTGASRMKPNDFL